MSPPSLTFVLLLSSLLRISCASPLQLHSSRAIQAGGPIAKPIPANCTLQSLTLSGPGPSVPGPDSYQFSNPDLSPADGFGPTDAFRTAQTTYSYFLPDTSATDPSWNESAHVQQCLEQCYGFGEPCHAIAWGHNVSGVTYGIEVQELACLFLGEHVGSDDLVSITNGSWTGTVVVNIAC